jgi:hypothetical protein
MTDTPRTNVEIRLWYHEQIANILVLSKQWLSKDVSALERAKRAWQMRYDARLKARSFMDDPLQVDQLRKRDLQLYSNPDGPTFEFLCERLKEKGLEGNAIYEEIILLSTRTNAEVDKKLGL